MMTTRCKPSCNGGLNCECDVTKIQSSDCMLSLCRVVCASLVFSQSLLSLDLIEDFLALKTDEAQQNAASDSVVSYRSINEVTFVRRLSVKKRS